MKVVYGLIGGLLIAWGLMIIFLLAGYNGIGEALAVVGALFLLACVTIFARRKG